MQSIIYSDFVSRVVNQVSNALAMMLTCTSPASDDTFSASIVSAARGHSDCVNVDAASVGRLRQLHHSNVVGESSRSNSISGMLI